MLPIISSNDLEHLINDENTVFIHAGANVENLFDKKHIKGAVYLDLDQHLSDLKNPKNGGRHPLPACEDFNQLLGKFGIEEDAHILIYDDKNGAIAASRLWWMLKGIGHSKVQVINGGLQAMEKAGLPLTNETTKASSIQRSPLHFTNWQLPTISMSQVQKCVNDDSKLIIDVRANERYKGITEPIDPVAGHIPSAINIPFSSNLNENGDFLSPSELKNIYSPLFDNYPSKDTIFHCGSGVTACHSILALTYAGFEIPNLYVGSWSEWCRNN